MVFHFISSANNDLAKLGLQGYMKMSDDTLINAATGADFVSFLGANNI